jgi:hypothetical protein
MEQPSSSTAAQDPDPSDPNATLIHDSNNLHYIKILVGKNFDVEYDVQLLNPLPSLADRSDTFNHPGPIPNGEYYVHSVCGEVSALIRNKWATRYLVRWTGWEDRYNTIEPKSNIGPTAAFFAFTHPDVQSGIGATKYSLRSSARRTTNLNDLNDKNWIDDCSNDDDYFLKQLKSLFKEEEKNKRFSKIVGFYG